MKRRARGAAIALFMIAGALMTPRDARAQSLPPPQRDVTWNTVSVVSMVVGASSQVLMPRIYDSESEVTVGWKARYHLTVLASTGALAGLAALNEYAVKPNITSYRPGCGTSNIGVPGCTTFGMPSTPTFIAFSAFGHGAAVFTVDLWQSNHFKVHPAAAIGDVGIPLVASILTIVGRVAGTPSVEHDDQAVVGAAFGFGFGLLAGGVYSYFKRAECPYGSDVICW
jgi:hypothetical protein